jgi:N-acetylgalactosamine kinase
MFEMPVFSDIQTWKEHFRGNQRYLNALDTFAKYYTTESPVALLRVPARINLKGVHIEHRGGFVNYMAIDKEALFIIQKRFDDKVVLRNTQPQYDPDEFFISEELPPSKRNNWLAYIQEVRLRPGFWTNYIKGGILRLQDSFADIQLKGMNILVDSIIPTGSGLSSSSSLVVGAVLAAMSLNQLSLSDNDLVELCGTGEWYVGTRGGAGDHSAMIFSAKDSILHTQFFPFHYERVPFPKGYSVVFCNSMVKAVKTLNAKNKFNEKVATYQIGLLLLKSLYPDKAGQFVYFRDVLKEKEGWIYSALKQLPSRISRNELLHRLPQYQKELESIFKSHEEPEGLYQVRNVCLFGWAECSRGEICVDFLKSGEINKFGELMYISHNGDRIASFNPQGHKTPWHYEVSDELLDQLIELSAQKDPNGRLYRQPGAYSCSCEELDYLVDTASQVPGVIGAGLTGAGLGGCVLVLVKKENAETLIETLKEKYYDKKGLPSGCEICQSVDGASFYTL